MAPTDSLAMSRVTVHLLKLRPSAWPSLLGQARQLAGVLEVRCTPVPSATGTLSLELAGSPPAVSILGDALMTWGERIHLD